MGKKKKQLPIIEGVTIEQVAAEGKALAHVGEMVVFVSFVVPGDVVDLQVTKKRHNYAEARVVRFLSYSKNRIEPRCKHFGICGGCKWQNLPYELQLKAKQKQVLDQLTRIGKVELPELNPIIGSKRIFEYRNKLEFGCSNKRWLTAEEIAANGEISEKNAIGFHITGAFDKVYPIEKCWLMDDLNNEIRRFIYRYAVETGIAFYDIKQGHGLMRSLMLREAPQPSGKAVWMLLVQFHFDSEDDHKLAMSLMQALMERFPQIGSLLWVDNQKGNDTIGDLPIQIYSGEDHIYEYMGQLRFKVGTKSFYQTNTEQAYVLYSVALQLAGLTGNELVYDLYTGTGTIANFVSHKSRRVIGIEYVPEAIEDAKENSRINHIDNTLFFAGDMKNVLTVDFINEHGRPDVVITDPPRAGMHPDVINVILQANPKRIVYVSCNPATQARDLAMLNQQYRVDTIQPVDMFPHTPHVENVVLLTRRECAE